MGLRTPKVLGYGSLRRCGGITPTPPIQTAVNSLTRRSLALISLAAALAPQLSAQRTYDQEKMAANYADMQTHAWFTGGGWITDFALAKAQSKETGKPIFAYFTRTYAP